MSSTLKFMKEITPQLNLSTYDSPIAPTTSERKMSRIVGYERKLPKKSTHPSFNLYQLFPPSHTSTLTPSKKTDMPPKTYQQHATSAFEQKKSTNHSAAKRKIKGICTSLKENKNKKINAAIALKSVIESPVFLMKHHRDFMRNIAKMIKDIRDASGNGILHYICSTQRLDLLDLMLDTYPNINSKNLNGNTPLHLAIRNEALECLEKFLKYPTARMDEENKFGATPEQLIHKHQTLYKAVHMNNSNLIDLLSKHIKIHEKDLEQLLSLAKKNRRDDCIAVLNNIKRINSTVSPALPMTHPKHPCLILQPLPSFAFSPQVPHSGNHRQTPLLQPFMTYQRYPQPQTREQPHNSDHNRRHFRPPDLR